jgi:polyhydroxyalkanoate synthesis regulator phasin
VRRKLVITTTTAGVLALSGLAVAVPALADTDTDTDGTGTAASAVVDRIRDALSGLVSDGSLTAAQADEVADTLGEAGIGGHGGHGGGRLDLSAAATTLGMTEEELRTALAAEDATLATVAEDRGVARDTLVTALTEAARERITAAVEDGRLTQEQADERLADLGERIAERVDGTGPGHRGGSRSGSGAAE